MSFVHLIIIRRNAVYKSCLHYRTALRILEQGADEFCRFIPGQYRDAGYIIIDYDKKTLISCQDAFKIPPIKGLEIVEV